MPRKARKGQAKTRKGAMPFEDVDSLDRVVHEPARLAVMAYLSVLEEADFVYLMNETGLTRGNLSTHMTKLQEVGYITVDKGYRGNRPNTMLALTSEGRHALDAWRDRMALVVAALA